MVARGHAIEAESRPAQEAWFRQSLKKRRQAKKPRDLRVIRNGLIAKAEEDNHDHTRNDRTPLSEIGTRSSVVEQNVRELEITE